MYAISGCPAPSYDTQDLPPRQTLNMSNLNIKISLKHLPFEPAIRTVRMVATLSQLHDDIQKPRLSFLLSGSTCKNNDISPKAEVPTSP